MNCLKLIKEGYKEIIEIDQLTTEIINKFAEMNRAMVNRINKRGVNTLMGLSFNFDLVYVEDCVKYIEMYNILGDFISNPKKLNVQFKDNVANSHYNSTTNSIVVKTNKDFENNLLYQIKVAKKDPEDNSISPDECYRALRSAIGVGYRSTIIHELQHAYDHYRSKGKYTTDKKSEKYYKKYNNNDIPLNNDLKNKRYLEYLKLPHEYWARFSQFAGTYFYSNRPFKVILQDFKDSDIVKFNRIPEKDQKILIKALYKFWQKVNEDLD